jgi:hypothetical protein
VGGAVAGWAAVAVWSSWPVSGSGYEQGAVAAAQQASSAIGTTWIVVDAEADSRLVPPYTATILTEQREAAAAAVQELLTVQVPDDASAAVRAELGPQLVAASDGITAVEAALTAGQPDTAQAAAQELTSVQQSLDDFVTAYQ